MNLVAIKYLFNVFSGSTPESGQGLFWDGENNWFTPDDLGKIGNNIYINESNRKVTDEGIDNANLRFGKSNSIIITKRAPIGNLAIITQLSSCNQGCFILEKMSIDINTKFYYYYLLIQKEILNSLGRGSTFLELNADEMKNFKAPLLSLRQQNKIVAFLDKEVAKIDALIEKKTKLLELLEEKKKAVISEAVTKGLDSSVSMKDSGIEWLGEIPEHWDVVKLKYIAKTINTGSTPSGYDLPFEDDGVNWYTPGDFQDDFNVVKNSRRKLSKEVIIENNVNLYSSNSVMFVGIGATLGKVGVSESDFYTNQQINVIELKDNYHKNFVALTLSSMISYTKVYANSATLPILNQQKLGEILIPVTTLIEQLEIIDYINLHLSKFENLYNRIISSIALLQEKRTAIISAAINGELDLELI